LYLNLSTSLHLFVEGYGPMFIFPTTLCLLHTSFFSVPHCRDGTGIYLDANLEYGRTETCRTFNNPPLCSTKDVVVSLVEVIGFGSPSDF
jgi:hypothetical protein